MVLNKLLGQILIDMGVVTELELEKALKIQEKLIEEKTFSERLSRNRLISDARISAFNIPLLGEIMLEMGLIKKEQLEKALNNQYGTINVYKSIKSEKLATAIEFGFILNSTLSIPQILDKILRQANRVANAAASILLFIDVETGELVFSVPSGPKSDKLVDIRIPPGKGIVGWVAEHKETVLIPNAKEDSRFHPEIDKISGLDTKSILCIPLKSKNKIIGVLEVINKVDGTTFTEEDALLLNIIACQAALAIESAMIYSKLQESETKYRALFDNAADVIVIIDAEGNFLELNNVFGVKSGYDREKIIGENIFKSGILTASSTAKAALYLEDILAGKQRSALEIESVRKDGGTVPYELKTALIKKNDTVVAVQVILRNIYERKQSEEALRKSKEKYQDLVENINDVIFSTDENGNITYVSPVVKTLIGYDPSEITGRNFSEFIHKDDLPYVLNRFQEIFSGQLEVSEYRLLAKTGEYRWICSSNSPIYEGDNIVGLRGIFTDITEQKHLEDQLRQSQKMEAIGTLAGGIAHEFNNVLGIIIGNTELAIDDVPEWNLAHDCLKEIQSASLRAKDVVRHILSFAHKSHIERKPVPISSIIRDTFKLLQSSIPSSIDIRQDISCEYDTVLADPTQINQVLVNLCTNSAHAMREEGGVLDVKLEDVLLDEETSAHYEDLSSGSYVKLTVKDTGHGIKPEIIDRIFDPYFTTKGVGEGTGMGLAVVHGIIKSHDGAITVNSELGKGTVVEVLLPITKAEIEPEVVEPEDLPKGNERILFVDDEASLVKVVTRVLEQMGYQVEAATNPDKALEKFRSNPDEFDLVISDMTMPQMTGDKLAKKLMEIRPDIPIIISTGFSVKMDEDKAKKMGIKAVVMKPFKMRDLAITARKVLDEK